MTVVYAETNFILELAYLQEQHASCEHLLALAESGQIRLVIPAFSLMEAQSAFASRSLLRDRAREALAQPVREIGRSLPYKFAGEAAWRIIIALLSRTTEEEDDRLKAVLDRILRSAELIPLETVVLKEIDAYGQQYKLPLADAAVFTSVMNHLGRTRPAVSCFLNRNVKDFDKGGIQGALRQYGCRLIGRFDQGLGFVLNLP